MNRNQRQSRAALGMAIPFRGRLYTIAEAEALAINEHNRGDFQVAVDIYDLILAKSPRYAATYYNRGFALESMSRFEDALASYDKAIALKSDYAEAYNNRSVILYALNRYDEALASSDKAARFKTDNAIIHNNRGNALKGLSRYDEAVDCYERAIALKPDYSVAYCNLGNILVSKGDLPEAEKMFLKALALRPDFARPLISLTRIRKYENTDHEDIKTILTLLGKPGASPLDKEELYFVLGKIYDDCGHYDEAFESYRQANQIANSTVSYHRDSVTETTTVIMEVFGNDFLAGPFVFASDSQNTLRSPRP